MLPSERLLVQRTWAQVAPNAAAVAQRFYNRLFELDPALRSLFAHTDVAEQGKQLTQMLTVAVNWLDRPEQLLPAIQALGRKHAGYGVRDEHYATVGQALLDTLAAGLGPAFTWEVRTAWTETYLVLAGAMQRAAAERATELLDAAARERLVA